MTPNLSLLLRLAHTWNITTVILHMYMYAYMYVTLSVSEADSFFLLILTLSFFVPNPIYFSMPLRKWHTPAVQDGIWGSPLTPLTS